MRKRSEHAVTMLRHSCRNFAAVVLLTAAFLLPVNALAVERLMPVMCSPQEQLFEFLAAEFSERPVAAGIINHGGGIYQLFKSLDGSTWTLVRVGANGEACGIAGGHSWQEITPKSLDPGS